MGYFPSSGDVIRGTSGGSYKVSDRIGRGAQGAVFSDTTGKYAIKIYGQASTDLNERRREHLRVLHARKIDNSAVVLPLDLVAPPFVGYVMEHVSGYRPIGDLATPPKDVPALAGYAKSGGLRARLAIGEQLTAAFRAVHLAGLAYCDLSFDNVLIPRRGKPEIRLIDCDNLVPSGAATADVLGTEWFIAPELLRRTHPPSRLTDAHSLAVLLFYMLTLAHPLFGDGVIDGTPEIQEKALRGELPWVDHQTERSNSTTVGMPRRDVLTTSLRRTFARAFEEGLVDGRQRPTEGEWLEVLGTARDALLTCQACKQDFYMQRSCPFCTEKRRPALFLLFFRGTPPNEERPEMRPVVLQKKVGLRERHLKFTGSSADSRILIAARPQGDRVNLENRSNEILYVGQPENGRVHVAQSGTQADLLRGGWFRLGEHGVRAELRQ